MRSNRRKSSNVLIGLIGLIGLTLSTPTAAGAPILSEKNRTAQCATVHAWVDTAREISGPGTFAGTIPIPGDRKAGAPAFADDIFPTYFGKTYGGLSKSDKRKLLNVLRRCSENNARYYFGEIQHPFQLRSDRYDVAEWQAEIAKHKTSAALLETKRAENETRNEQEDLRRQRLSVKKVPLPHRAGELLADMPDYRVHAFKRDTHHFEALCSDSVAGFYVSVVIKDHNTKLDSAFTESIVRETLAPLAEQTCSGKDGLISAELFFDGVHLGEFGQRLAKDNFESIVPSWDRPFMRLQAGYGSWRASRASRRTYFDNKRPGAEDAWAFESLESFEHIARQRFATDRQLAEATRAKAEQERLDRESTSEALRLVGFELEGGGGTGLVSGIQPARHFESNGVDLVKAIVGYSVAITESCPATDIPDGTTIVTYTTSIVTTSGRTGMSTTGPESSRSFEWPAAFYSLGEQATRSSDQFGDWLDAAPNMPHYRDIKKLTATKGCGSEPLLNYHHNLLTVSKTTTADWKNMAYFWELMKLYIAVASE